MTTVPPAKPILRSRHPVTVDEYIHFRRHGFLVVRGLVAPHEAAELREHTDDLMQGRLPEQRGREMAARDTGSDSGVTVQGLEAPPAHLSPEDKADYFLRIHMLHRQLELHERYMLHPGVLDVLEVIIGPDVLAMQTMLFLKGPGKPGQGWHQDSYYIPTHPDTLCGAWIAIDDCDERNGAMWFAMGSGHEPVYPPCPEAGYGFGDKLVADTRYVRGVSNPNDAENSLSRVADRYDQVLCEARAGDVVFFNGHVLHRSKKNWSKDRFRRSFVSHYCNARSYTQWGAEGPVDPATRSANNSHILARGDTHLAFAKPRFRTPCAALQSPEERRADSEFAARAIASLNGALMGCAIADPTVGHVDHGEEEAGY